MSNPLDLRRISLGLILAGAVLAGLGDGIRSTSGTGEANWTFFLDVIGLLLAVAGGVLEAKSADIMFDFAPAETRFRALVRLIAAFPAALIILVSLNSLDLSVLRGAAGSLLVLCVGIGLGGLFSLVWIYGGNYAAERIQDRANDDWR
jgi:hypothetical protein